MPKLRQAHVPELASAHILLLDTDASAADVLALMSNRYPRLLGKAPGLSPQGHPEWRIGRHATLSGPVTMDADTRAHLGCAPTESQCMVLHTKPERSAQPPPPWLGTADPLVAAFPHGLPERAEERLLHDLIAVARRLHARVRLADEPWQSAPRILAPDPEQAANLFIYSSFWLSAEVLRARLAGLEPELIDASRVALEAPASGLADLLPPAHQRPSADPQSPAAGVVLDGYGLELSLCSLSPRAGVVEIAVGEEPSPLPVIAAHLQPPYVQYLVRWFDTEGIRNTAPLDAEFIALRRQVIRRMRALAASIFAATGGIGHDEDGLLVSAHQLSCN